MKLADQDTTESPSEADAAIPAPSIELEAEADRARCGVLSRYWYVACLSEELGRTRPLGRMVFGVPLALFRDAQGAPVALFDRCLHRNAALSAGCVLDGKLACAYHGWVYDAHGHCVEIPSLGPAQTAQTAQTAETAQTAKTKRERRSLPRIGCPAEAGSVERWPTFEQDGLVFVYPGGPSAAAARRPAFRTPHFAEPGWTVYYMVTRFPNGVTNLAENFMDVPHTAFVHRGWFRTRGNREIPTMIASRDESVLVTYEEGDRVSGAGRLFNFSGAPAEHTDKFYAPHVTRVDYRFGEGAAFVITSQVTPVGPLDSLVYTAISYRFPFGVAGRLAARTLLPLLRWYTHRVIEQDVGIMAVQSKGLSHAPGGGHFLGTAADGIHEEIERWRRWLRSGAPESERPAESEQHIRFFV